MTNKLTYVDSHRVRYAIRSQEDAGGAHSEINQARPVMDQRIRFQKHRLYRSESTYLDGWLVKDADMERVIMPILVGNIQF